MPRTTLDLDATVLEELRARSVAERRSMGTVASELLATQLAARPAQTPEFRWTSRDLGEPLVDLEDKEALWAALDGGR